MKMNLSLPIFLLCLPFLTSAFELSPMEQVFSGAANQASHTFYVINDGGGRVALQLRVFARSTNLDGSEARDLTNDFLVFPQQVMLVPNEKRAVRVTYRGASQIPKELSYRLVAEQLPVNANVITNAAGTVSIKYLTNFVASIYVTPAGAEPRVAIESLSVVPSEQGQLLQVNLVNRGNKHMILKGTRITLRSGQSQIELDPTSLKPLENINLLAGEKIAVGIPYPSPKVCN